MSEAIVSVLKRLWETRYRLSFLLIIAGAVAIRVENLNYNSPFNDEAIYVVIGKMGLFENDFYTYNARSWMAGVPYIYPILTALSYYTGGIVGSRLLNVIFGVLVIEQIYLFTKNLRLFDNTSNEIAGIFAAVISGFAGVGVYASRLATYDILSFLLFFLGLNSYLKARFFNSSKYYFLSALSLMLAFFTKSIVGIYLPFLIFLSLLISIKSTGHHNNFWRVYFFAPMVILTALYIVFNAEALFTFMRDNVSNEYSPSSYIIGVINQTVLLVMVSGLLSSILLIMKGKFLPVFVLAGLAILVPLAHILIHRASTIEKHLYLSVLFLSPLIGYSLALVWNVRRNIKYISVPIILLSLGIYIYQNRSVSKSLELAWLNTYGVSAYLRERVNPNDRLLSETGAATILALYDKTYPTNVTTFDWIDYGGDGSEEAYINSVKDGYYRYIALDGEYRDAEELRQRILEVSREQNYLLVYKEGDLEIYEKTR